MRVLHQHERDGAAPIVLGGQEGGEPLKQEDERVAEQQHESDGLLGHTQDGDVAPRMRVEHGLQEYARQGEEERGEEAKESEPLRDKEQQPGERDAPEVVEETPPVAVRAVVSPEDLKT